MHLNDRNFDTCLGIIVLDSDWWNLLLPAIRVEICRQLHAVSNSFVFLTSEGFVNIVVYCIILQETLTSFSQKLILRHSLLPLLFFLLFYFSFFFCFPSPQSSHLNTVKGCGECFRLPQ